MKSEVYPYTFCSCLGLFVGCRAFLLADWAARVSCLPSDAACLFRLGAGNCSHLCLWLHILQRPFADILVVPHATYSMTTVSPYPGADKATLASKHTGCRPGALETSEASLWAWASCMRAKRMLHSTQRQDWPGHEVIVRRTQATTNARQAGRRRPCSSC